MADFNKKGQYIQSQNIEQEKNYLLGSISDEKLLEEIISSEIDFGLLEKEQQFLILIRITNYSEAVASYGQKLVHKIIINMINRIILIIDEIGKLFRIRNEEFLILGKLDKDIQELDDIIETINNMIDIGFNSEGGIVFLHIAMGILPITYKHTSVDRVIEDLILSTDLAEKSDSTNYIFYEDNIREKLQMEVKLETLLRSAIDNRELSLLYQPQIDPKTNEIVGVEALVRWNNKELGQIPPYVFIPIAEKIGIINDIGNWVLREACRQNKEWQEKGLPKIPVSVNLSPIQFKNKNIGDYIGKILKEYDLEGKYLGIEITEGTLIGDRKDINKKLSLLKDLGVFISIDDFGTGYSSLGYLKELKFDSIKIDREFIKDYPEKDNGVIAKIILNLSNELKINSIAEGVETKEQLDFITANGGNIVQGYYYSPPVSAEKIEELLLMQNESD